MTARHRPRRLRIPETAELRRATVRIGAMAAGLLLAVLVVVSSLVVLVVLNGQNQQATATLKQAISSTHDGLLNGRDADDSSVRSVAVAVSDRNGLRTDGTMPAGLPDRAAIAEVTRTGKTDQRQVEIGDRHYAIRTVVRDDRVVQAVLDLHEQREEIVRLLRAIMVSGLIGVVLVASVAALLGRRAVRPLAEALELQQRFVADAAHELRTPLTLLSTRAQIIGRRLGQARPTDPALASQLDDGLRGLADDAANLTEILEDLLLAADRNAELPDVPVDLGTVAREAVAAAEVAAQEGGIAIQLSVSEAGDDAVKIAAGSRPAVLRAANALIDNAVSHARSQVQVRVAPRAGCVDLEVADDGPGIDAETLPTIFDRFASQRPDGPNGPVRRHYGLGLALVSDVASRHRGTVTVEQRPDGRSGALFRLRFPLETRR
ncbi:MAG: HAMP domain-containing histidine kinase [Microlunatus sp.]|nr:HAMP domain-containing histidine kinase [Microlunatus sp.]